MRAVFVGQGPASFATAAAGARALLAVASSAGSALFLARGDSSAGALPTPFSRTPLSAGGAGDVLAVAWLAATSTDSAKSPAITVVDASGDAHSWVMPALYRPALGDLLCSRGVRAVRCALGVAWRDEFRGADDGIARFYAFEPTSALAGSSLPLAQGPALARASALAPLSLDPPGGAFTRDGRAYVSHPDGGATALDPSTLDQALASDGEPIALRASASSSERCQPGAWRLTLASPGAAAETLAAVDARPRGARVRRTGARGDVPLALWLDAPQCSESLFVIRAHRQGSAAALTSATEYDAASDRALLSLAWREGDRVRWARYRCP